MPIERMTFLNQINANPCDKTSRLVFADWLDEHDEPAKARKFRIGPVGRSGRSSFVGRAGRGGLTGRGGRGGFGGRIGGNGLIDFVGPVSPLSPEAPIVLIPGEPMMVFWPHGYGCVVLVGRVTEEHVRGWMMDPVRTIEQINPNDANDTRWVELANVDDAELRRNCIYGPFIKGGMPIPEGVLALRWHGELPK